MKQSMRQSQIDLGPAVGRWTKDRFTMRSGYYAGRGPTSSDLDSSRLEGIYKGLKAEVSPEAATAFVRFVNKLDDLSASSFIVAFERFWRDGCKEIEIKQDRKDRVRCTGRGDVLEGEAFCAVAETLFGGGRMSEHQVARASDRIKQQFIRGHRDEIPDDEKRQDHAFSVFA